MVEPPRPYLSSFKDRHGTFRWRFRRGGRSVYLAGQPGEPAFEAEYEALITGQRRKIADMRPLPGATVPRSFRAAWRIAQKDPVWLRNTPETRARHAAIVEAFLTAKVSADADLTWADVPVEDLKRRHVKAILAERADTPHAARHLLTRIRQMIVAAMDEEWIEHDPTHKISWRPEYKGWRAWTDAERQAFERHWPVGTTPRLVYALAIWQGHRRSDIARLKPDDIAGDLVRLQQKKTGKVIQLPIVSMLREVLAATDLTGKTVLRTKYGDPFSAKSLTGHMAVWTKAAGLPPGCTIHGLRKTLGKLMAEGGASTRELMDVLGHDDINHAELYSREAEQVRMARQGLEAAERVVRGGKRSV
ncbi:tyrosine-type recombinase/integrase [Phreatobacter oligotrophus]|uniref:Site-specific recombinase XerD n=1 Tax=Phreatobacter oligotrophus TaxID=1122261 RepID=A0A2T4Z272_9HYPH|nr:tyrosine-type recombinase/integrase [Phreatobacter oligotrophus]PTM54862.1 site-specific recombinase XerD [Phreatobacter oligotrophus]